MVLVSRGVHVRYCVSNDVIPRPICLIAKIKRIIHLEVQSKPMYLRTLLYALRQGVALDACGVASTSSVSSSFSTPELGDGADVHESNLADYSASIKSVPDRLLDLYLSSEDSITLTSKVLDVYATYVDEGQVSAAYTSAAI